MEMASTIFFWLFATGAVLSSIAVVIARIPLYSAIALILDFFFLGTATVVLPTRNGLSQASGHTIFSDRPELNRPDGWG